mmetsp:Transcript_10466/g.19260  ORF Transcript_10466/g.19260 Transcript_10466/m.19260 type:complete len:738 (+) Transcript_10466:69-2282(+)
MAAACAGKLIIVAGPPASGKGTQCKRIVEKYGLVHISLGDLCREYSLLDTELGIQIKEAMEKGDFVPDELALRIIKDRLEHPEVLSRGCLLDGFPRTAAQAEALLATVNVDKFTLLQVPDDLAVRRALQRRLDPETGAIYNLEFLPPPPEAAARLVQRENDKDEGIIRGRLGTYHEHIGLITPYFEGKTQIIDSTKSPEEVFEAMTRSLPGLAPSVEAAADDEEWPEDEESPEDDSKAQLQVALDKDVEAQGTECQVMVSIKVPEAEMPGEALKRTKSGRVERAPADVCCVVDISGSMRSKATYEVDGVVKDDGLIYLDIVKHAVKSVMHILKDQDRFALVAFDDRSEIVFPLGNMTAAGRDQGIAALEALQPRGRTDIWGGIRAGMEAMRAAGDTGGWRQKTIMLLTDGVPNESPTEGELTALRAYKESFPGFNFQLNTFGFGYNLRSELLLDLAIEGQGTFAFIPDAVIVGTTFVNSVCNALSTHTQNATLHLMAQGGAGFNGPVVGVGGALVAEASWGRVVSLGPLQFGQAREVVVPMTVPAGEKPYLEAVLVIPTASGESRSSVEGTTRTASMLAAAAASRAETVAVGYDVVQKGGMGDMAAANSTMKELASKTSSWPSIGLNAVAEDVTGRMTKALDGKDRFNRWGKHYLRALTRAHQLQVCTNFMDKGLQDYGGTLFKALRDEGDAVFLSLPAPKASAPAPNPRPSVTSTASRPRSPSPDMKTYYGGGGGG